MKMTKQNQLAFIIALIALMLAFVALFAPAIKVPVVGAISIWKASALVASAYGIGQCLVLWLMSKNQFQKLWWVALVQVSGFVGFYVQSLIEESQKGRIANAVELVSAPVSNLTVNLLVNNASLQVGAWSALASLLIFASLNPLFVANRSGRK